MRLVLLISTLILLSFNILNISPVFADDKIEEVKPIKNFDKVDENYFRGAKLKPEHYTLLKNLGIKTEVDFRDHSDKNLKRFKKISTDAGMKYFSIPMNPFKMPTASQVEEFLTIINNPDNLPVYVHCTHGQDRTGFMSAIYRVEKYNWGYDQCYEEMLKYGYHNNLYGQYKDYLKDYIIDKNKQSGAP